MSVGNARALRDPNHPALGIDAAEAQVGHLLRAEDLGQLAGRLLCPPFPETPDLDLASLGRQHQAVPLDVVTEF